MNGLGRRHVTGVGGAQRTEPPSWRRKASQGSEEGGTIHAWDLGAKQLVRVRVGEGNLTSFERDWAVCLGSGFNFKQQKSLETSELVHRSIRI